MFSRRDVTTSLAAVMGTAPLFPLIAATPQPLVKPKRLSPGDVVALIETLERVALALQARGENGADQQL